MKQLFKYVIMLFAVVMSYGTISCDKDPDPEPDPKPVNPDPVPNQPQLSSLEINIGGSSTEIQFKYKGNHLSSIKERQVERSSNETIYETISTFEWNPLHITYTSTDLMAVPNDGTIITTLSSEGYITSAYVKGYPKLTTYEYDDLGQLIKIVADSSVGYGSYEEQVLTWENGLLTKVTENWREGDRTGRDVYDFYYGEKSNSSGIWPVGLCYGAYVFGFDPTEFNLDYYMQTGLFGNAPSKLPIKIEQKCSDNDYYVYEFLYSLNEKGYVTYERVTRSHNESVWNSTAITYTYR